MRKQIEAIIAKLEAMQERAEELADEKMADCLAVAISTLSDAIRVYDE